jgi:malonyl-CoA/methylmalonyl-CoA synthetase
MLDIIQKPLRNPHKTAIVSDRKFYSYQNLQDAAISFASILLSDDSDDLKEARVAFMVSPGFDYVSTQWGIWLAGGIAVPLCTTHPLASLVYVIDDSQATIIVVTAEFLDVLEGFAQERNIRFMVLSENTSEIEKTLPFIDRNRSAMILYTSGTTNLPKGVLSTHANIAAQVNALVEAWEYSENDHQLCILPLHHVHGIINVISATLYVGAAVEFLPSFSAEGVFSWFKKIHENSFQGVFMAVPTIYFKLIAHFESLSESQQAELKTAMKGFRLMVSGSAALPISVMEKWQTISGHRLLERYGMTEIGMAISNPFASERRAGHIGQPLPGVEVRLVDEENKNVKPGEPGEIQVKGPTVFKEYWQKPEATADTFTKDAWFKTGDIAVIDKEYYKILGRNSVDIIKSGGYKISALEIEEILRIHSEISDCAVVGIENEEWGEIVVAALVVHAHNIDLETLNSWARTQMPTYRTPRKYIIVSELPRNAMGKVVKNEVKKMFNL